MSDRNIKAKITPGEIDRLNNARALLSKIAERVKYSSATEDTRLEIRTLDAIDAIFSVLSTAHAYCGVEVTEAQLFEWRNEAESVPVPQSLRA